MCIRDSVVSNQFKTNKRGVNGVIYKRELIWDAKSSLAKSSWQSQFELRYELWLRILWWHITMWRLKCRVTFLHFFLLIFKFLKFEKLFQKSLHWFYKECVWVYLSKKEIFLHHSHFRKSDSTFACEFHKNIEKWPKYFVFFSKKMIKYNFFIVIIEFSIKNGLYKQKSKLYTILKKKCKCIKKVIHFIP